MNKYPDLTAKELKNLGYDNVYFPFEDYYRNDRLVAFSHDTGNRIEIYNNFYPLKYNENTGLVTRFTYAEIKAIDSIKNEIGWVSGTHINYLIKDNEEQYKDDLHRIR